MITKWSITIPELTGDEPRSSYVYVPDAFEEDPEARYPVLYMFDGHNVFFDEDATYGKSWGMADFVNETQLPLIIAAVECNHHPDNGRLSEYSPFTFDNPEVGHVRGRGHTTMEWLVNTFKPYIDAERAVLCTEAYQANKNQPPIMKRALMLKNILEKMTIYIENETMIVGNQARMPSSILKGVRTLTTNIVLEMGYATDLHREALIATAVVLFVFVLVINLAFSLLKRRGL